MLRPHSAVIGICQPDQQIMPGPIVQSPKAQGPISQSQAAPTAGLALLSFGLSHQPFKPGEVGNSEVPTFSPEQADGAQPA